MAQMNCPALVEELKKQGVTTIVRIGKAIYNTALLEKEGIHVLDWPFDDGAPPSNQIADDWSSLIKVKFLEEPGSCIAVHCVVGLGGAQQKHHRVFNSKQLLYLEK
ncbi:protein tyrosine phosphatase type IVA 1-like isoform X2 [Tamandua tetradactyla]|uniref:protein tyrosine phosphatase type IVA 1-like isoform X2 n=1 Tax=Tamandua tetradactyla TaxID=48850 RepID=UPI0040548EF6